MRKQKRGKDGLSQRGMLAIRILLSAMRWLILLTNPSSLKSLRQVRGDQFQRVYSKGAQREEANLGVCLCCEDIPWHSGKIESRYQSICWAWVEEYDIDDG